MTVVFGEAHEHCAGAFLPKDLLDAKEELGKLENLSNHTVAKMMGKYFWQQAHPVNRSFPQSL